MIVVPNGQAVGVRDINESTGVVADENVVKGMIAKPDSRPPIFDVGSAKSIYKKKSVYGLNGKKTMPAETGLEGYEAHVLAAILSF